MKPRTPFRLGQELISYLFLLPALGMFLLFVCVPAVQSFYFSLMDWDGIGPKQFVGLRNYINLVTAEPLFWKSITNSLLWALTSAVIPVWIGLFLANFLVRGKVVLNKLYQVIFFLPQVISTIVAAVIWKWAYDPVLGPINGLLHAVGLDNLTYGWLGDPKTVMAALFVIYVWQTFGFSTVIFISAIQSVNTQLYDASKIDGCGSWGQFRNVTIPGIRQATTSITLLMGVWSFQVFDLVMTTTKGGPGYSSYVVSYYVFSQGFMTNKVGYGAASSIFLALIILIISRLFMYIREKD